MEESNILYKITIPELNVTKGMRFLKTQKISHVRDDIEEKFKDHRDKLDRPEHYSIFNPEGNGYWLDLEKELKYYNFQDKTELQYKRSHVPLKVRTMDGAKKTVIIDETKPISENMQTICLKIGILNYEEFSLIRLRSLEEDMTKDGAATINRTKTQVKERDQKKMERLKQKLDTDDNVPWINNDKPLWEQGIEEWEELLLKRKLFVADDINTESNPVQMNLLYIQCRDAIIKGIHPVTDEEAIQLAGIQCVIQFGEYDDKKHKPGLLNLDEFLPSEYVKRISIEKKILKVYKEYSNDTNKDKLSEDEDPEFTAKKDYVKTVKKLDTYGIAFFLVKEPKKGIITKLVPRLFGINSKAVYKLDETTKQIMETWELTSIERYSQSENIFTLHFGSYRQPYSIKTPDALKISRLLKEYIDILMKKNQLPDHTPMDGAVGEGIEETIVEPIRAVFIQNIAPSHHQLKEGSVLMRALLHVGGKDGKKAIRQAAEKGKSVNVIELSHVKHQAVQGKHQNTIKLTKPQQALLGSIDDVSNAVESCISKLNNPAEIERLGQDKSSRALITHKLNNSKMCIPAQLAAMNAATANIMNNLSSINEEVDASALSAALHIISSNLPQITDDVRFIAAIQQLDNSPSNILEVTQQLLKQYSSLLSDEDIHKVAGSIGLSSDELLNLINGNKSEKLKQAIIDQCKAVAASIDELTRKAMEVGSTYCQTPEDEENVYVSVDLCDVAKQELTSTTNMMISTLHDPVCLSQLRESAKNLQNSMYELEDISKSASNNDNVNVEISKKAKLADEEIKKLMNCAKVAYQKEMYDDHMDKIIEAVEHLGNSFGDPQKMLANSGNVLTATQMFVDALDENSKIANNEKEKENLRNAVKGLTTCFADLLEATNLLSEDPQNLIKQKNVIRVAESIQEDVDSVTNNGIKKKIIKELAENAKEALSTSYQCITAGQAAAPYNSSNSIKSKFKADCDNLHGFIPILGHCIENTNKTPDSSDVRSQLINACKEFIPPGKRLIETANESLPATSDRNSAIYVENTCKQFKRSLSNMKTLTEKAEKICTMNDLDLAIKSIKSLIEDLDNLLEASDKNNLKVLPGDKLDNAETIYNSASNMINSNISKLLKSSLDDDENLSKDASQNIVKGLGDYKESVRVIATDSNNAQARHTLLNCAKDVGNSLLELMNEIKEYNADPCSDKHNALKEKSQAVKENLNKAHNNHPNKLEIKKAITNLNASNANLDFKKDHENAKSYNELQKDLEQAASKLNQASYKLATSSNQNSVEVAKASQEFAQAYAELVQLINELNCVDLDGSEMEKIKERVNNISLSASELLEKAVILTTDPNAQNPYNEMKLAAKAVSDCISDLIDVCISAAPSQKQCDNAIRSLSKFPPMIQTKLTTPVNNDKYIQCIKSITKASNNINDAVSILNTDGVTEPNIETVAKIVNEDTCKSIESALQAAYLVCAADPSSVIGTPGVIDMRKIASIEKKLHSELDKILHVDGDELNQCKKHIISYSSNLANIAKSLSTKVTDKAMHNEIVTKARNIAVAAKELLDPSSTNSKDTFETGQKIINLRRHVDNFISYIDCPRFAGTPTRISEVGHQNSEPILQCVEDIVDSSLEFFTATKTLATNPKNTSQLSVVNQNHEKVAHCFKNLLSTINNKIPGKKECNEALTSLNDIEKHTKTSYHKILKGETSKGDVKLLEYNHENACKIGHAMLKEIEELPDSCINNPMAIGKCVAKLECYFEPMMQTILDTLSNLENLDFKRDISQSFIQVCNDSVKLINAASECAEYEDTPKFVKVKLHDSSHELKNKIQNLLSLSEKTASNSSLILRNVRAFATEAGSIDNIKDEVDYFDNSDKTFVSCQIKIVDLTKDISKEILNIRNGKYKNSEDFLAATTNLLELYKCLVQESKLASHLAKNRITAEKLQKNVQDIGQTLEKLMFDAHSLQKHPNNQELKQAVSKYSQDISDKISSILVILKSESKGTQSCIDAASTIKCIVEDLETTIMFASAGTLEDENIESFIVNKEQILKNLKLLVENSKQILSISTMGQEELSKFANDILDSVSKLSEVTKNGAISLGSQNSEVQVQLLNTVKDVASSVHDTLNSAKSSVGKPKDDPSIADLSQTMQLLNSHISYFQKTIQYAEDKHTRGTKALERTIETISQEIRSFEMNEEPKDKSTAEDLLKLATSMTVVTAKVVRARNSGQQEDIMVVANTSNKTITDLLLSCKGAAYATDNPEIKSHVLTTGRNVVNHYMHLLNHLHEHIVNPTQEKRLEFDKVMKSMPEQVKQLVTAAQSLKDNDQYMKEGDQTDIAETGLKEAAKAIELAAKKLAALRPRQTKREEIDENLNFDEIILEACKSITKAIQALVSTADSTQRELEETGRVSDDTSTFAKNSQWSDGLHSAANYVAVAIDALCESANDLVLGHGSEQKLIAASQQVTSSTAHLLLACQVKADVKSENAKRLNEAGQAVKKANESLVNAARNAIVHEEEVKEKQNKTMLVIMKRDIEARQKILELEEKIIKKEKEHAELVKEFDESPETASVSKKAKEVNLRKAIADLKEAKLECEKQYKLINEKKYEHQTDVDTDIVKT